MEDFYFTEIRSGVGIYYSEQCKSTSALLLQCIESYYPDKVTAVYTYHQTAGKGQGDHTWESEPGKNLALSIAFPGDENTNPVFWNMALTLGVRSAISQILHQPTFIKWPNDIFVNGLKISGLLLESTTNKQHEKIFTAGVGVNVNQSTWMGNFVATSIYIESKHLSNIIDVLHEIIDHILFYYNELRLHKYEAIKTEFNANLLYLNTEIQLDLLNGETTVGVLRYIDEAGRICLEIKGDIQKYHHGEARIRK